MTGAELGAARLALGVAQAELGLLLGGSEVGPVIFVPPGFLRVLAPLDRPTSLDPWHSPTKKFRPPGRS